MSFDRVSRCKKHFLPTDLILGPVREDCFSQLAINDQLSSYNRQNELVDYYDHTGVPKPNGIGEPSWLDDCEAKVISKSVPPMDSAFGGDWRQPIWWLQAEIAEFD